MAGNSKSVGAQETARELLASRLSMGVETPRSWDECRTFLEVTRSKSFSEAGEVLGLSTPTVSRHVKRLEDISKSPLVTSSGQGIELTSQGKLFAERLLGVEREFKKAFSSVNRDFADGQRLVRIAVTEGISCFWLLPSFNSIYAAPSYLNFDFVRPPFPLRPTTRSVDITISFSPLDNAAFTQVPLGWLHLMPLVSGGYVAARGKPTRENLAEHDFIQLNDNDSIEGFWSEWRTSRDQGRLRLRFDGSIDSGFAARSGGGICMLGNYALLEPALQRADIGCHYATRMYATVAKDVIGSQAMIDTLDWLAAILGPENPWFQEDLFLGEWATPFDDLPRGAFVLGP